MDPYRSVADGEHPEAPRDPGIVGDVIAQFAEPTAFLRELVQNAIDAGSPAVEVRIDCRDLRPAISDVEAELVRVSVKDRGEGMTRAIIEDQLLVLFRSTKETDSSKIGKFGIGFASVLAPNPDVVAVTTTRDGRRLVLHLYRDLTYQLFDAGPASQTGTTVELDLAMAADAVADFARAAEAALSKWCRHATVPIHLTVAVGGDHPVTTRIDRPLAIDDALVQVRGQVGDVIAVVGVVADAEPYVGFFNHGLTLYETNEALLGRLAVKVQDPQLGHTLSRDNVRRDARFAAVLAIARDLAERALPGAAAAAIKAAAETDLARHRVLVGALRVAGVELPAASWVFPLVEPRRDGGTTIAAGELPRRTWVAAGSTAITRALDAPVLRVREEDRAVIGLSLHALAGVALVDVHRELTAVTPAVGGDEDWDVIVGFLRDALAAAKCEPVAIVAAHLDGVNELELAIAGLARADAKPYVIEREHAKQSPFARLRRVPLVLSTEHPLARAARDADDPRFAATHLARAILLGYQLLDVERSERLMTKALDDLGLPGAARR